jgi:uncharacterized protein (TIGR02687 family)
MIQQKVTNAFTNNPALRVLFLFDEKGDFENEVKALELESIRCVFGDEALFTLKRNLHTVWANERVFLYFKIPSPHKSKKYLDFPLIDLLEANMELVMDDEEAFLEEFGLNRSQKSIVKKYIKELQYSTVQKVCSPILTPDKLDEHTLQRGLISSFLKFKEITSWDNIIAKTLLLAYPEREQDWKRFHKKLNENSLLQIFDKKAGHYFGPFKDDLDQSLLTRFLQQIRYNQITQWIQDASINDPYKQLKIRDRKNLTAIFQLIQQASAHPQINGKLKEALDWAGKTIHGTELIKIYGSDAEYGELTDSMSWTLLSSQAEQLDYSPKVAVQKLEKIFSAHKLNEVVIDAFEFAIRTGEMISQINSIHTYTLNNPEDYILRYTVDWNKIDTSYRRAIQAFKKIVVNPEDFDSDKYYKLLNKHYDSFLEKSNREWLKCLNEFEFDYSKIKAPKQFEFFDREIKNNATKTVVIISDALRYEAAKELLGVMHGDDKNVAEMDFQIASIPSKTSLGMAQLLPHQNLQFNQGNITESGINTEGINNRDQILKIIDQEAIAIQFSKAESMPRTEARELFKSPLVYVYHDVIDARGDKRSSERGTFNAVTEAVADLSKFISKLHHTYSVTRVFVTSDHGFIYQDMEIQEQDKEPAPGFGDISSHNRYEISSEVKSLRLGYCFPLGKTSDFKDGDQVYVIIPESINRYKKQGVGHQFIHGGGSLQEIITPVINSYRKSQAVVKKVKPLVANESKLRIISNILRVSIIQEKKVSRNEKELNLILALYKDSELVSNEVSLTLNSTSDSPSDRVFKVELILNNSAVKESFIKLKGYDLEERLNPLFEIRVQNQTIIPTDF